MVTMDIHFIHGEPLVKESKNKLSETAPQYSINQLLDRYAAATSVSLHVYEGTPVYVFKDLVNIAESNNAESSNAESNKSENQATSVWRRVDATNGVLLPDITKEGAIAIAKERYVHHHDVASVSLLSIAQPDALPTELSRRHLPVWQIQFDHFSQPTLYISQQTGRVVTKRHNYWRLFDWMWRFHIMDYDDGENVANYLLTVFSVLGLLAVIAGAVLTYHRIFVNSTSSKAKGSVKKRVTFNRFNEKVHKWVSLIVFIQLVLWIVSGIYFNLMADQKYNANMHRQKIESTINFGELSLFPLNKVIENHAVSGDSATFGSIERVALIEVNRTPIYQLIASSQPHSYQKQTTKLVHAITGEQYQLDERKVNAIALMSYSANANILSIEKLLPPIDELPNQRNKVWRVAFEDAESTNVYISDNSGQVISHVNDSKRLRNFMFKLHFMDYGNVGGFNNWQNIFFALFTLLLSITGAIWVIKLLKRGQYVIRK